MKHLVLGLAAGLGLAALGPFAAMAQVVTIGTNAQGSLAFIAGAAVSRVASQETDLTVRAQALSGSTSFIPMLDRGEVDFGFAGISEFIWAHSGTGTFAGSDPAENLRLVGMVFPLRSGIAVVEDTGLKDVADLKARAGDGLRIASDYPSLKVVEQNIATSLELVGLSYDDFTRVPVAGLSEGMQALGDGRVDISWVSFGSPLSRQIDAALSSRGGWRYLNMAEGDAARAKWGEAFPGTRFVKLHNPEQPGIREPVLIQEVPFMMATHKDTPEEVVYKMTRMIAEHQKDLGEIMPTFRALKVDQMAQTGGVPYHPGALRAYEELAIPVAAPGN